MATYSQAGWTAEWVIPLSAVDMESVVGLVLNFNIGVYHGAEQQCLHWAGTWRSMARFQWRAHPSRPLQEVIMILMSPDVLPDDFPLIAEIDANMKDVFRKIVFSPSIDAANLLQRYMDAIGHLRHVLEHKNAQQEAQSEEEAAEYFANLEVAMGMMIEEIGRSHCIASPIDLFRLFRTVAPEAAARHVNHYRQTLVQVGRYLAPDAAEVENLVENVFWHLPQISNPLIRAIYLHHELIRIHPFADGNGRVGRMAKNGSIISRDLTIVQRPVDCRPEVGQRRR